MSREANKYVQGLKRAPNGEKITPSEKLVLDMLADRHNKDLRYAFPSLKNLAAESCDITVRHCRRILRSLEEKGLIEATMALRESNDGQSSNLYRFVEIDPPFAKELVDTNRKRMEIRIQANRKLRQAQMTLLPPDKNVRGSQPVPMPQQMSGAGGHRGPGRGGQKCPGPADTVVRGGRTSVSGGIEPVTKPSREPIQKEPFAKPAIPTLSRGERVQRPSDQECWDRFHLQLQEGLISIPQNVVAARGFTVVQPSPGARPHSTNNDYDVCFRDWHLVSAKRLPNGLLLETYSDDEAATAKGLEKYKFRLQQTARRCFRLDKKMPVTFRLLRKGEASKPSKPSKVLVLTSMAASQQEAEAAVKSVQRDAWERVKERLQELLLQRRDAGSAMSNFRDAIAPVKLLSEGVNEGKPVWALRCPHVKKTQAVTSMFRRELDVAIRDVAGAVVTLRLST